MIVVKRDGQRVDFDMERIKNAILKAAAACKHDISDDCLDDICKGIANKIGYQTEIGVEAIQDIVESELMSYDDLTEVAKAYILYRNSRTNVRELNTSLMKTLNGIFSLRSADNDLKRENANIDADAPMGVMLKVGSETTKDYSLKFLMKSEHAKAHIDGDIHIHDLDFYPSTETCVQIPLGKLLSKGFVTGHGYLRPPQSIASASALTCIAIQSSQNDMHGGQSIPCFDYDLAPYVAKTFIRNLCDTYTTHAQLQGVCDEQIELECGTLKSKLQLLYDECGTIIYSDEVVEVVKNTLKLDDVTTDRLLKRSYRILDNSVYQAMESLVHNLNTMNSRAG